jgi:hypothetical protein
LHTQTPILAVAVISDLASLDVICVSTKGFVTDASIKENDIGIGDEVFSVGLFSFAAGEKANMPIVRTGNISMLPVDQIQIDTGGDSTFTDVYLVEARSIGGLSGSPVFVRPTAYVVAFAGLEATTKVAGVSGGPPLLLGLMHGHWDINEADINRYDLGHSRRGVNVGIGIVIPAKKILELLNDPDLVGIRERAEQRTLEMLRSKADGMPFK